MNQSGGCHFSQILIPQHFRFCLSPLWLSCKESVCNAEDQRSIPGSGRSPEVGHGYPLHYSCLDNPMDRGAWQAMAHSVAKSQTQLKLSKYICSGQQNALRDLGTLLIKHWTFGTCLLTMFKTVSAS